jgi:hypothetical protein
MAYQGNVSVLVNIEDSHHSLPSDIIHARLTFTGRTSHVGRTSPPWVIRVCRGWHESPVGGTRLPWVARVRRRRPRARLRNPPSRSGSLRNAACYRKPPHPASRPHPRLPPYTSITPAPSAYVLGVPPRQGEFKGGGVITRSRRHQGSPPNTDRGHTGGRAVRPGPERNARDSFATESSRPVPWLREAAS